MLKSHQHEVCSVLVVEADPQVRGLLVQILTSWGIEARQTEDLRTAVPASLTWGPFQAIICAETLPDGTGTLFLHWLREQVITVPFLLISSSVAPDIANSSRVGLLRKPFEATQLRTALERLLPGGLPSIVAFAEPDGLLAQGSEVDIGHYAADSR